MNKLAIIGAQWGDEGKGKVVNYFSKFNDIIVRSSGGANAGHTIYFKDKKYVHHLLPSITFDTDSKGFLAKGMVIELEQMIEELKVLEADFPGISKRFMVDVETFIVLPYHKEEDGLLESMRKNPIGTTKRGIGPAYQDKAARQNVRIIDLFDDELLRERVEEIVYLKNNIYEGKMHIDVDETVDYLLDKFDQLLKLGVTFTSASEIEEEIKNKKVLFEGAQGIMLDLDSGTYPYVTSSTTTAYSTSAADVTLTDDDTIMGVVKAYTSRVGEGEFPTELFDEKADKLRNLGNEFGATTGRNRRVGWIDLAQLRYAIKKSKINSIVMTKADVLNGYDKVKVCVGYEIDGIEQKMPFISNDFKKAKPIYKEFDGWDDVFEVNFLKYMTFIEKELDTEISYVSYGPKTEEIMEKRDFIMNIK